MKNALILGRSMEQWKKQFPLMEDIVEYKPVFWTNAGVEKAKTALKKLALKLEDMEGAEKRWKSFAPLIMKLFPETEKRQGIIESELTEIPTMKECIEDIYGQPIKGRLFMKCDNTLPVAGSIKARGGIYEVLKHAEELAMEKDMLKAGDDYSILAEPHFREFFGQYSLAVGSTGNLGLSIGIMGSALGFKATVHMSADAKEWKKRLLRSRGVTVVEYTSDYSKAVEEGRRQSLSDPKSYFVDDEHSVNLFLGYSTASYRLKSQLEAKGISVDEKHPLFVYLPCGVGGAPGGICFGLKQIFGDNVHCFFVEPTHAPCMLLGLMTGENDRVSVQDFGLDNITAADGLAVGRPSGFVGSYIKELLEGVYTIEDNELYKLLALLRDSEQLMIEPSAASGLLGPSRLMGSSEGRVWLEQKGLLPFMENSTHICWATGGLLVPKDMLEEFYTMGKELL